MLVRTALKSRAAASALQRTVGRQAAASMSTLRVSASSYYVSETKKTEFMGPKQARGFAVPAVEPADNAEFDTLVKSKFPGAMSNPDFQAKVVSILESKGLTKENTLLCTSLCADELSRALEDDLIKTYGNNFNLGGLAGFPFAGNTGFGAMSAHIPDGGYCLVVYAPHVGITADGTVGKVERVGMANVDNCCGAAIAASNFVAGITDGGAAITMNLNKWTDFQQGVVQQLILPHGKRLNEASERMVELPYALYDSQDAMVSDIVAGGAAGTKSGAVLLGGIQINTGPSTFDYFHPLKFQLLNTKGEVVADLLPELAK